MKKLIIIVLGLLTFATPTHALSVFQPFQGGTGSSSPSGILVGNGTSPFTTLLIGSNLTFSGGTLSATGGSGSSFSTTSADFWISLYPKSFFFSTTSAAYWLTLNQGSAFSTTSATAFGLVQGYLTSAPSPNSKWATSTNSDITPNGGGGTIVSASSTYSILNFGTLNGSFATTTSIFSTTASSTNLSGTNINGFGLSSCSGGSNALTFNSSNNRFGCNTISGGSASSTLLTDNNYFGGQNTFSNLVFTTGTSTNATTTTFAISKLATPAGSYLAVDGNGLVIATTSPANVISNVAAYKMASKYATVTVLPANTYLNGVLTEVGTGALSVDGSSPAVGDRVLVKNEATQANNGIYTVTATGSGIAAYVLTRSTDFNTNSDVFPGVTTYINSGSYLVDTSWTLSNTSAVTIGTTALTFATSSAGALTAGNGIIVNGNNIAQDFTFSGTYTGTNIFNLISLATSTQATSTAFFSTNLFGTIANLTNLIFGTATGTNATTTSLSTTALVSTNSLSTNSTTTTLSITKPAVTGCTGSNALQTASNGNVVCGAISAAATTDTALTPYPNWLYNNLTTTATTNIAQANTTVEILYQVIVPFKITISQLTTQVTSCTTGTQRYSYAMYSVDGQTQEFNFTGLAVAAASTTVNQVTPVTINPGIYWLGVVPWGGTVANCNLVSWDPPVVSDTFLTNRASTVPLTGTLQGIASGTPASSFTPSSVRNASIQTASTTPVFKFN